MQGNNSSHQVPDDNVKQAYAICTSTNYFEIRKHTLEEVETLRDLLDMPLLLELGANEYDKACDRQIVRL